MVELLNLADRPLVFIREPTQWRRLEARAGSHSRFVVASADFDLTYALRSSGVDVIDLLQFATEQQGRESFEQAWAIAEALRASPPVAASLPGCNLVERTANEVVSPWSEVFFQGALIDACLASYRPGRVYGFPEVCSSYEWDYPANQPKDVFNATVMHCAAARGIPHSFVDVSCENAGPKDHKQPAELPLPRAALRRSASFDGRTICFAPKFAALGEMRALIQSMCAGNKAGWLTVTDSDEALGLPTLRQEILLTLPFDLPGWDCGSEALSRPAILACLVGRLDKRLERMVSDPTFAFIWDHYCNSLSGWARWYAVARFLAGSTEPSAVVVGYDALAFNRAIEAGFAATNVPALSIDHVGCGVDASHRRNIGGQAHVAVWGEADCKGQKRWRDNKWKVVETGTLRQDHSFLSGVLSAPPKIFPSRSRAQGSRGRPRIVLLTSKFATPRSITGPIEAFERSWSGLFTLIGERSDWEFVLKPHPVYDHHAFYASSASHLPNLEVVSGVANDGRGRAQQILETADVAVLVNCPTTTVIDAIALGVPVLYLKDATWPESESPVERGLSRRVDSTDQLETEIDRLLSDASYRDELVLFQTGALSRSVVAAGENAVDRVLQAIEDIRAPVSEEAAKNGIGLSLIELMISAIGSPGAFFRWAFQFRALWADGQSASLQLSRLGLAGAAELKVWIWRMVIERCRRTSSTGRALVFFSIAAALLPVPLRLGVSEVLENWRRAKIR